MKKYMLIDFQEANLLKLEKIVESWSYLTGDFSKKKNKSLGLLDMKNRKTLIGSTYPNRKAKKAYKRMLLNNKKVLKGYKIVPFKI